MDFHNHLPRALYTAAQTRELDRIAIEEAGMDAFGLMHRAGQVALGALLERWPQVRQIRIYAGNGNNGGDGYVVAALARQQGLQVRLWQVGDHSCLAGAAARAAALAASHEVPVAAFSGNETAPDPLSGSQTVTVDALLGTGVNRSLDGDHAAAVRSINGGATPVLALDIPSGLCSDTGKVLGVAVRADVTVTFIAVKRGMLTAAGVDHCGEILHHDLDVPAAVFQSRSAPVAGCQRIDMAGLSRLIRRRSPAAHKGDFGHVVVVGGDLGYGGAVIMAGQAALRAGSGLVSVITRLAHVAPALTRQPELMALAADSVDERVRSILARASVLVVGPGLGRGQWALEMLQAALAAQTRSRCPMVLDADALNLLAERGHAENRARRTDWVLTPHPGEAARLLETDTATVQADRFAAVAALHERWGGHWVLKGAGSLLCSGSPPEHPLQLCTEGNAGMASGGMGDVLSGIIGGLLAQGWSPPQALSLGVCVHGESADLAAADGGQRGLAATDLMPWIRRLLNAGEGR